MADIDSFGYYEDEDEEVQVPKSVVEDFDVEEEEVEAPRTDADADAAETLASFPKSGFQAIVYVFSLYCRFSTSKEETSTQKA